MARLAFLLTFSALPVPAKASHTLTGQEQIVLKSWLAQNSEYRTATDEDCDCTDDIKGMKAGSGVWKPVPDYHPYVANGDFNGDGLEDFAVVVIERSKQESFTLLVFNGPFRPGGISVAFIKSGLHLKYQRLFYGSPRPKPYRLLVGRFESDSGLLLTPQGSGYRLGR